ncbi:MAG: TIGR03364 family FAD-dependent oxidoreductase [Cytophagaceae bacterium]|nr:TIGR03364 family FAD-dependent oxidoreductase [Cytophagaceae bacterium]
MMKYDLIIVGAGVMGTFHAFHAAKKGKKVLLLEKNARPVGSTIQNFGQVVPSGLDPFWQKYGRRSLEIYNELQNTEDLTLVKNGSVYIASDEDELLLIKELQQINDNLVYKSELLDANQTALKFPDINKEYIRGSIFFADEFSVDSSKFIYKVLSFCQKYYEVDYRPNSTVTDIKETQGEVYIKTAAGKIFCGREVIVCGGYETSILYPEIFEDSGLEMVKLQMLKTIPLHHIDLKSNILTGLTIRRYEAFESCPSFHQITTPQKYQDLKAEGIHILFKQLPDKSIIIGDSHHYAPVTDTESLGLGVNEMVNQLMKEEARRIINVKDEEYAQSWAGYYVQHPDGIFEFQVSEHVSIRTGIGGKGMTSCAGYTEEKINELFPD